MLSTTTKKLTDFLILFKKKIEIYGIVYHLSNKNAQTLLDLEINPIERKKYLLKLEVSNYYRGPIADAYDPFGSEIWEFGMNIKNCEIYIKVSLGHENKPVLCKSFHISERQIKYPLRKAR